jgi:opacity protein-like surface antigen
MSIQEPYFINIKTFWRLLMVTTMKKTVCVLVCALLFSAAAFAADIQGSFFVNGGFSAGALQPHFVDKVDNTFLMGGRLQADYALKRYLSLGLETGYNTAQVGDTDFSIGAIPILARIAWHPFALDNIDPYIVGKAGYGFCLWTEEGDDYNWTDPHGGFVWGASLGTRFFFTQNVGMFIEAGYECLDAGWEHPGMKLEKWEDSASARTFATIGIALKFGK